jgi:hypothetical protein
MSVDDETAVYILENRRYFEDLRQVAAQLAGLLVLAAAGGKSAAPDHPMLESAEHLYNEALDGLRGARITPRARENHEHLLDAAGALRISLSAARRHLPVSVDPILAPLRAAYTHLQRAVNSLPGFAMVAFEQGCCAVHLPSQHPRPGIPAMKELPR